MFSKVVVVGAVVLAIGAAGCAADSTVPGDSDGSTVLTAVEELSSNSCSAGMWHGYALKAYVRASHNPDMLEYYFHGVPGTVHNNAAIEFRDRDGNTGYFATPDDIRDRTWSWRWAHSTGGSPTDTGPGSQSIVTAIFDIPGAGDKACKMSLTW